MQQEIIRRFDEVLATKVSKISLFDEAAAIEEKTALKFNEINKQRKGLECLIEQANSKIDDTRLVLKSEMEVLAAKLTKQINQLKSQTKQTSNVLEGEGVDGLKRVLKSKADKAEVEILKESKCNKIDAEMIKDVQILMGK